MKILLTLIALTLLFATCKKDSTSVQPTAQVLPILTTLVDTSSITRSTAKVGGNIASDGGATVSVRGVCYNTNPNPTKENNTIISGSGTDIFSCDLINLTYSTKYYVRAYATNSKGTAYGNEISFTSHAITTATLKTNATVTSTTISRAIVNGEVLDDGGSPVTARGICWGTLQIPTISDNKTIEGSGVGSFNSALNNLTSNTTFYLRAFATNNIGTSYGEVITIVTDVEGNIYNTIKIGAQIWMVENLKVTKFNNGANIPNGIAQSVWLYISAPPSPLYCWYNNDINNKNIYGALYNWLAVNSGLLSPPGWHIPSNEDFRLLIHFLDPNTFDTSVTLFGIPYINFSSNIAGKKLAEKGSVHWEVANGTNESGFTALPGGWRNEGNPDFTGLKNGGIWWSSSNVQENNSNCLRLTEGSLVNNFPDGLRQGFSVRCVKN